MFDRWKSYIHMKKLYRYWLQYVNNRSVYIKSDIAMFFGRWKHFDKKQKQALKVLSKEDLDKRTLKNAETLENLADKIDDKEEILDHMND